MCRARVGYPQHLREGFFAINIDCVKEGSLRRKVALTNRNDSLLNFRKLQALEKKSSYLEDHLSFSFVRPSHHNFSIFFARSFSSLASHPSRASRASVSVRVTE
jgi:hypothetical protein